MEEVTVATCYLASCSWRGGRSVLVVGVKLSFGVGSIHGGGPGGTSVAETYKLRLRCKEGTVTISRRPVGRTGGRNWLSKIKGGSDQLRVMRREMRKVEALNSEASDNGIYPLKQG